MIKHLVSLCCVLCLAISPASALDKGDSYLYGGVGYTSTSMEFSNLTAGIENIGGIFYHAGGGYGLQQNMALGVRLNYLPYSFSETASGMTMAVDTKLMSYLGTFTLFFPLASGGEIFIQGGLGIQAADSTFTLDGIGVSTDESDTQYLLATGFIHSLAQNLHLIGEVGYSALTGKDAAGETVSGLSGSVGLKFDING